MDNVAANGQQEVCFIVGLGNPGVAYEETRHNIGFKVAKAFVKKHGLKFRPASHFLGDLAEGPLENKKVIVMLPMTFMNSSGDAVRLCADYFRIQPHQMLVICDDVALPFGKLRMREKGSSGGHNGLKSIEAHLNSQSYPRLRIGVGGSDHIELADYVLGKFTAEERVRIPEIVEKAIAAVETWVSKGITKAMLLANAKELKEEKEKSGD